MITHPVISHVCIKQEVDHILPVFLQCLTDVNIGYHISVNQHKVRAHKRLCIYIPEHIT